MIPLSLNSSTYYRGDGSNVAPLRIIFSCSLMKKPSSEELSGFYKQNVTYLINGSKCLMKPERTTGGYFEGPL